MSRETKTGIAVFFLALIIGAAGLFMTPSRLFHRNTYEIHAVFDNAQGIRENAQVLYARFTIDTSGVVGDLYVKISGGRPGSTPLSDGMTVQEYKSDRMDQLMTKAGHLLDTAKSMQQSIEELKK